MRRISMVLLFFSFIAVLPSMTRADASPATITFRVHDCPHGFTHQEFAAICNSDLVPNASIALYSTSNDRLKGQGNVDGSIVFSLPPGTYRYEGPPGHDLSDRYLTCAPGDPDILNHETVVLNSGDEIDCILYLVGSSNCDPCPPTPTPLPGAGHIKRFWAIVCDHDPGVVDLKHGVVPTGCTFPSGISISASTGDGKPIGTCVTELHGYCALHVLDPIVIVTEQLDGLPPGYFPQANPILQTLGNDPPVIVNIPVGALPTIASADSSITVHSRVCPPGYTGQDYVADCHGTPPDYPQSIFLEGDLGPGDYLAKTVDLDGDVTFSQLLPEPYQLMLGLPPDTASTYVACSTVDATGDPFETHTASSTGWSSTLIVLGAGQDLVCDAYTIPPAA